MPTDHDVKLYHNPRCTKSRQTLELLRGRGIEPTVIEYLKQPPDEKTLARLVQMLGLRPIDLVRTKEKEFSQLGLDKKRDDDQAILKAMAEHPVLIERPIVVKGNKVRLGRPPEQVLEIL